MAVHFEVTEAELRLRQTRRGLRVTFAVASVVMALNLVLQVVLHFQALDTTLDCSHATAACTLKLGQRAWEVPLTSITSVRLEAQDDAAWVWFLEARSHQLCGATDAEGRAAAEAFAQNTQAFLNDASHPPLSLRCTSRAVNGPGLAVLLAAVLGWLVLFMLFAPYSDEVTVEVDRRAGTLRSKGRAWLTRPWDVTRRLAEVERVNVFSTFAGHGGRRYTVSASFRDGTHVKLWTPAMTTQATIDERVAQLRAVLTPGV